MMKKNNKEQRVTKNEEVNGKEWWEMKSNDEERWGMKKK